MTAINRTGIHLMGIVDILAGEGMLNMLQDGGKTAGGDGGAGDGTEEGGGRQMGRRSWAGDLGLKIESRSSY